MTFRIITLGCKANQADSAGISALLERKGYTSVKEALADIVIINTCAVTGESAKKSRSLIRRAKKENPGAFVAICGCFSELSPEEVADLEADLVAGSKNREGFVQALLKEVRGEDYVLEAVNTETFEVLPAGNVAEKTRALLKVQDGCENFCTYCIVPYARGQVRSMPLEDAVLAAKGIAEQGYKELVVTGIEISSWGKEFGGDLVHLLGEICKTVPRVRVRLGSLEPRSITEDFCETLKQYENLAPHFHLSLQSGSDSILEKMGRKYNTERYLKSVFLLGKHFSGANITTDIIVGFPGEGEGEFEETVAFVKKCGFSQVHVFPYSKREGTKAAEMQGMVPQEEKARRSKVLRQVVKQIQEDFLQKQLGQQLSVLFEKQENEIASGYSLHYCQVEVKTEEKLTNQVKLVAIQEIRDGKLVGYLI